MCAFVLLMLRNSNEAARMKKEQTAPAKSTPKKDNVSSNFELRLRPRRGQSESIPSANPSSFQPKKETTLNKFKGKMGNKKKKLPKLSEENIVQHSESMCSCGNPAEYGLMIQCDACERWYHSVCAHIDEVVLACP
eukprot:TRINITY_DN7977_c0_g1_i12.p1 TRINITY_DN7977_c0_g1~~TRINITY_DN7977_c0_g1_i12.p1  ORF type:complete len:136 (-),score=13.07 TRINITY_DN7977_c0_g1_i12:430-837(-)